MLHAIISWCVRRRLATVGATLLVAGYGVAAYFQTPIEAYPDVTNVQVNVIAQAPGLAPEEVERQVTIPLEKELNGTPGMTVMRSESLFGLSLIWLVFQDDADSFKARMLVQERIAGIRLPEGVSAELAPDYTPLGKIFYYRLTSPRHTLYDLRSEQDWTVSRVFRQVDGVADVIGFGGFSKELHVEVDPDRLMAYDITIEDVSESIRRSNLNVGGGILRQGDQDLVIRGIGYLTSVEDLRNVVLRSPDGSPITVGDVARVVQSHTPRRGSVGMDEEDEIVQGIILLRRGQNPNTVIERIHEKVEELNSRVLPSGMKLEILYDRSRLTGLTLSTVHNNLLHGFLLIVGVVWLLLRSLRGSLIVATVIPLSLLTAFIGLFRLGLPANLISMGAIDFGILVDGAVVLVENVFHEIRHRRPQSRKEIIRMVMSAAVDVARPTFYAMSIILASLLPVFTLQSVEGRIFRPLALTYSFALLGALVFALTIIPALCALFMRPSDADIREPRFLEKFKEAYVRHLGWLLGRRRQAMGAGLALLLAAGLAGSVIGTEFLPELDEGDLYVFVEMPASISLERAIGITRDVRLRFLKLPEVISTASELGRPEDGTDNEGVNMAKVFARLKPRNEWRKGLTKDRLVEEARQSLQEIPGVQFNFSQPIKDSVEEAVAGVRGKVVLKVFGTDLEEMRALLLQAVDVLRPVDGIVDLGLYRDSRVPQLQIQLKRDRLAREGMPVSTVLETLETALAGRVVTDFREGERMVPVRVRMPWEARADTGRIGEIYVETPRDTVIQLRELADISIADGRAAIAREANQRYLALKFNIEGRDMGSVIQDAMAEVRNGVEVPEGMYLAWGGEFENQQRAMTRLKVIVPVALIIVITLLYMALKSGRSVLAILLLAPFGMTGGLFGLLMVGVDLSVSAVIGFITLLGQVCLMGLLILSAIEARRRSGEALVPAMIQGAADRLRPVLMASLLAAMGLTPMVVSTSMGSETQRPFATVIVFGMVTTFLVSIYLLPVIYSFVTSKELAPLEADDEA
ncbi:MAG: efflux RND transporter permease subunit [Deltaproteobacteria bacterium]|nr:efflux RND transporter permease subunit [Deltaproteobacteria bacterium]